MPIKYVSSLTLDECLVRLKSSAEEDSSVRLSVSTVVDAESGNPLYTIRVSRRYRQHTYFPPLFLGKIHLVHGQTWVDGSFFPNQFGMLLILLGAVFSALVASWIVTYRTILFFRLGAAGYEVAYPTAVLFLLLLPLFGVLIYLAADAGQQGDIDFLLNWLSEALNLDVTNMPAQRLVKRPMLFHTTAVGRMIGALAGLGILAGVLMAILTSDLETTLPPMIVRVSEFSTCAISTAEDTIHPKTVFGIGETVWVCGYVDFLEEPQRPTVETLYFRWHLLTDHTVQYMLEHTVRGDGFFLFQLVHSGDNQFGAGDYEVSVGRSWKGVQAQVRFSVVK